MPRKSEPAVITEKKIFPTRLRELMQLHNTTQKALADAIEMRPQTVSLYVLGQSNPDIDSLKKIAEYFDVSADYLLGLAKEKSTDPEMRISCKYTGLSEPAIEFLHSRSSNREFLDYISILSELLESNTIERVLNTMQLALLLFMGDNMKESWGVPTEIPNEDYKMAESMIMSTGQVTLAYSEAAKYFMLQASRALEEAIHEISKKNKQRAKENESDLNSANEK